MGEMADWIIENDPYLNDPFYEEDLEDDYYPGYSVIVLREIYQRIRRNYLDGKPYLLSL